MKILSYKLNKYVFVAFLVNLAIFAMLFTVFKTQCFGHNCGSELLRGLIVPLFWFEFMLTLIISMFFFFPEKVFKDWLNKIAWWYGIGLFLIVVNTPVFSSNILFTNRSETVFWGMILLGLITIPFIYFETRKTP